MKKYLIIDFDSTINKLEALDELAKIVDQKNGSNDISNQIAWITELGMKGEIDFKESLSRRMEILSFNKVDLGKLIDVLRSNFTDSFVNNKDRIIKRSDEIIVVSGGFKDFIIPALDGYGIKSENIYANEFTFDEKGNSNGFDTTNLLADALGKVKVVQNFDFSGYFVAVGDGFTDYQIREKGSAEKFVAFVENISRPSVTVKADYIAHNFDEVFEYFDSIQIIQTPN